MNRLFSHIKSITHTQCAFLIFLLITFIYLFPAFIGKVDTPVDIRDMRMYPWRYHMVDKKISLETLWNGVFPNEESVPSEKVIYNWKTLPNSGNDLAFNVELTESALKQFAKLSESNYYVVFDFKPGYDKSVAFSFGLSLINKKTRESYTPGVAVIPLSVDKNDEKSSWYKAQFPLNNFLSKLASIKDINQYEIHVLSKNKSNNTSALLYLRDLKLVCEDFSHVTRAHNHYNNDLIQMFTPLREFFSNSLKMGQIPFWNNYIFTGTEFLTEPQVGFFHPVYFLTYLIFEHFTAHIIITFLCLFLGGFGAYLLTYYWGFGFLPSLLTGIVYMFQPFNATWLSYEHMIMNSAVLPFLLLSYEYCINEKKFINKHLLLSSFLLGLIFLSGHLQYVYYSAVFFGLYGIFKLLLDKSRFLRHLFGLIFIFVFGIMIGAIVIIPFMALFANSHRGANPIDLIKATSVPLKAFTGLFYPFYQGVPDWPLSGISNRSQEYENYKLGFMRNYVYFGFLPLLLSFFSLRTVLKEKITIFFFITVSISLLICMGSPVFFLIREIFPGFKEMQHYRFLQLFSYSVPFIAGIGFKSFLDYLKFLSANIKKYISISILVITFFDLIYFSSYFVTWSNRSDYKPVHKDGVIEFILKKQKESKEPFRVLPFASHKVEGAFLKPDIAEPNTLLPYMIEDASGYSSFIPKDIYYLFVYVQTKDFNKLYSGKIFDLFSNINTPYPISNFHSKILDLLNVKYFIVPNFLTVTSDKVEKIFTGDSTVYENKKCLPRAFVVPDYKVIESDKLTIVELDSDEFDPRKEVLLMAALGETRLIASQPLSYTLDFIKYEQNNIVLKAKVNREGFLVLGHHLNNNWKVKINNVPAKHFQANLVQRAVYLPKAGEYLVDFYYFSKPLLVGLSLTCFSLLVLISLYLFTRLAHKKTS